MKTVVSSRSPFQVLSSFAIRHGTQLSSRGFPLSYFPLRNVCDRTMVSTATTRCHGNVVRRSFFVHPTTGDLVLDCGFFRNLWVRNNRLPVAHTALQQLVDPASLAKPATAPSIWYDLHTPTGVLCRQSIGTGSCILSHGMTSSVARSPRRGVAWHACESQAAANKRKIPLAKEASPHRRTMESRRSSWYAEKPERKARSCSLSFLPRLTDAQICSTSCSPLKHNSVGYSGPSLRQVSSPFQVQENKARMAAYVDELNAAVREAVSGGGPDAKKRLFAQGKMPVRTRIDCLLDPGSSFLELSQLAGHDLYGPTENVPCGGLVTGVGLVSGRLCMIVANDPTVKGGAYFPITVKKHLRAQDIAAENRLPCIYLVDSGGANLSRQEDVFPDRLHFGRIFFNQATMSAQSIPQIAVVLGSCTAGGAYVPAMADEAIIVKGRGTIFLAGPPLVKAATGEIVGSEELGGADMHCRISGVADHYAKDENHALKLTRRIVASLPVQPSNSACFINSEHGSVTALLLGSSSVSSNIDPLLPSEELDGLAPCNFRQQTDIKRLLACLLDRSALAEFKPLYGETLVCGFAHLNGYPIGVMANNGVLLPESALKGAHFIQICAQRRLPLLFVQNITGFMVGSEMERAGIAKHGAKLVTAVSCFPLPKLTLIIGASFGAGNYGMCGRAYDPRFLFTWPNAKIAVMGGKQAVSVLLDIERAAALKRQKVKPQGQGGAMEKGKLFELDEKMWEEQRKVKQAEYQKMYDRHSSAIYASARIWDDGVVTPQQTRKVLILALAVALQNPYKTASPFGAEHLPPAYGVFRM
ncbi:putative acyl-CoA carboxyltransferase beta chain [Toxoplasma gondii RUB]|uniref:methylcrotonoyl-CoA carboxylase n=6 Tax=Toxoplasma gondii TaxID=5811 RepID=V4ZS14_TOXGV|nr:putative acyl-CoA carboxyltransferase beta chain [Toxoplasma gondii VEG]KFG52342.1 putative acyl-CoA carboxyltransferase beta chain [Toxoplasma gondii p89]KFG61535.1 putative acyl-CoA carboxyltransferase beta chain [Toxoplasma gondii RUB]KFH06031.1 putative acyl-CoA carboxyltransferase beta chain [Toxoplasma gondii VAND]PIM01110.1 putative acyl-CoA carboxyltransferase beta chain [Toxoplasma gondii COUG]PUA87804.1 putative acyl-CoA carboxyltransferase beta chain [Toxoplasma gondii TgCATBr9]